MSRPSSGCFRLPVVAARSFGCPPLTLKIMCKNLKSKGRSFLLSKRATRFKSRRRISAHREARPCTRNRTLVLPGVPNPDSWSSCRRGREHSGHSRHGGSYLHDDRANAGSSSNGSEVRVRLALKSAGSQVALPFDAALETCLDRRLN